MSQQLATFLKQEAAKILAKVEQCGVEDNGIYRVRFNRINLRLGFKITQQKWKSTVRKNDLYYSFLFLPESALTVNQPRSRDVTSQSCPLHPRALDWQGGYAGGLSSGLCHCAVTLHLESYISASSPTSCWFRLPLLYHC